jgi:hypothetical protein
MSDLPVFSLDNLEPPPAEDTQAKVLHNALAHFCDEVEQDNLDDDTEKSLQTRDVIWRYGQYRFRAKLITFAGQASLGQYDYTTTLDSEEWQRLTTPRALAEKLTEARDKKQV